MAAIADCSAHEHEPRSAHVLDEPGPTRELEGFLELGVLVWVADGDRDGGVESYVGVAETFRELEGAAGPARRLVRPRPVQASCR